MLGAHIGVDRATQRALGDSFKAMSESYSELFKSIQATPSSIFDYPHSVILRSPIEYYAGAELCRVISVPDQPFTERELFSNEIIIDNRLALARNLYKIDPELVPLWDGANQTLASDNADKIKHFSTSVRELMTHVLHRLSPDEDLKSWSSDTGYYKDGRPTREARLMYVCRNINVGPFQEFVKKDVAATIEFINLFQEGTHTLKSSFTEGQVLALKARTESTLNILIEIGWKDTEK